jgi:hypothetical protein
MIGWSMQRTLPLQPWGASQSTCRIPLFVLDCGQAYKGQSLFQTKALVKLCQCHDIILLAWVSLLQLERGGEKGGNIHLFMLDT